MEIRARYILMGLFTLAVILGGFAFVYWLETAGAIGKRTSYEVRFKNTVSGLLTGSAVLFNGIRVGEVTQLKLVPDEPRLVDATISIDASTPVRADTEVSLEFQGLTGVAVVTLTGGTANAQVPAAPNGQLPRLFADEAAGQSMSEAARQALGRVNKILADNADDLRSVMSNLATFSEALGRNSSKVDGLIAGLERMTGGGKTSGVVYSLNAVPAPATPAEPLGTRLAIADPSTLLAYDSERILAQNAPGTLEPLGAAKWSDTLPKLMQAKILQSFENNGALGEIGRPADGAAPGYQLLTEIRRFQIVTGTQSSAEAEISARIIDGDGQGVAARIFSAKEPLQSKDEAEAPRALDAAFQSVVINLMDWTRTTLAKNAGLERAAGAKTETPGKKR